MSVDADVRNPAARPDQVGAELECLRNADRLDRDIRAEPAGELHDRSDGIDLRVVDRHVCAELVRLRQPGIGDVEHDDAARRVELGGHDRREPDRARADDGDGVPRLDVPAEHTDLVRGREDVREEDHLVVREAFRHLVHRRVGERHPRVLGLKTVDQVAEDPAASTAAEAIPRLLAEAAAAARGDAGDQDAVAGFERRDRTSHVDDGPDRLVTQDPAGLDLGDVALEDVQVGAADGRGVDPDECVRRLQDRRVGNGLPGPLSGTVIDERLHGSSLLARLGEARRVKRAEGAAGILLFEPGPDALQELDEVGIAAEVRPKRCDHAVIVDPEGTRAAWTRLPAPIREFQ